MLRGRHLRMPAAACDPRPRRRRAVAALLLAAVAIGLAARHPASASADTSPLCAPGRLPFPASMRQVPGRLSSLTLEGHHVLLYVPGATQSLPELRVPVVYFLHGAPGAAQDWISGALPGLLDRLIAAGSLPPLIGVIPDEQGVAPGDSWWGDTALGDAVESWLMNDLVPTVDASYCTLGPAYRGIAGLSAGGFGAVNLALRETGRFGWAAGYSGVYTAPIDVFGPRAAANSPQRTVSTVPPAQRFPLYVGGGAQDRLYLGDTMRFTATLEALHWQPLRTEIVPGPHSWQAWSVEVADSLIWLGELWGRGDLTLAPPL